MSVHLLAFIIFANMDTNFPQHTKEAWLEKVKKELPEGKTLLDLLIDKPLYQHDGFAWPGPQNGVEGFLPSQEWKITAHCYDNLSCHQALQNGAEAIWLSPGQNDQASDLLAGVHLDYINTLLDFSALNDTALADWQNWLNIQSGSAVVLPFSKANNPIDYAYLTVNETTTEALADLIDLIQSGWQGSSKGWLILHEIGSDFYGEIAWLRALKSMFLDMNNKNKSDQKLFTIAQLKPSGLDPNQDLIRFTYQALSAVLGGIDFLAGPEWRGSDNNYARLAQNLQHLMKQEGKLHLFTDALAGSYFIEDITLQLVKTTQLKLKG